MRHTLALVAVSTFATASATGCRPAAAPAGQTGPSAQPGGHLSAGSPERTDSAPAATAPRTAAASSARESGERRPAEPARPALAPAPEPLVVPAGTALALRIESTVSSKANRTGDRVLATVTEDVRVGGRIAVPAGSEVRGRVTAAVPSGRVKGRARLAVAFDTLEVRGRRYSLEAGGFDATAKSSKKRDTALIAGGAGAGGIIGGIADGKKGAGLGVLIGGAAGGGAVLATKGKDVTLPAGAPLHIELQEPLRLE